MSTFQEVLGKVPDLTDHEASQLVALLQARLPQLERVSNQPSRESLEKAKPARDRSGRGRGRGGGRSDVRRRGNPRRTSQWAKHPLYQKYKTAKKAVEAAAKEQAITFAAVEGPEKEAYQATFSTWLATKKTFSRQGSAAQDRAGAVEAVEPVVRGSSANEDAVNDGASEKDSDEEMPEESLDLNPAPSAIGRQGVKRTRRNITDNSSA